jgi:hypothetical protein
MTPKRLPLIVAIIVALLARPARSQQVKSSNSNQTLSLDNGQIAVTVNTTTGGITATADGKPFLNNLGEGQLTATLADHPVALGPAKSIEIQRGDGSIDRIVLTPNVPFLFLQRTLRNRADKPAIIDRLTPVFLTLPTATPLASLRVLGCDGLTPADQNRASYTFLAAADPQTRAGVVAGWITNDRASGIVLSQPGDHGELVLQGRSDYGRLRLDPGASADGEIFAIGQFADALDGLEAYADAIARYHHVKLMPIPSGYCTWYSRPHGGAADEKSLEALATFAHDKLAPFGFNLVQIDDKWQVANRDYTTHKPNGPYPSGMKPTADMLKSLGLTPGIWFIPFGWDPKSPVFKDHADYFVHHADGSLYEVKWAGTCLDMTHPGAREVLRQTVSRITHDWGYKYLKIDGLWTGMATQILYPNPAVRDDKLGDAVFHDPNKTNIEAFRDGLRLVRQAAGDDVFIDGCNVAQNMRTLGASFGLVDAMRVGRDIGASWDKILPSMTMATRLYFFHHRVWHNDPDCLMLREPLTIDQARAWGSWITISGQLNLVSEWLPGLPEDRLDIVKRSMPNTNLCGRPIDLFDRNDPRIWHLTAGTGENRRDIIGLFNWDPKNPAEISIPLAKLGLPSAGGQQSLIAFDYWKNEFLPPITGDLKATVPPASCRVLALRPVSDHPQVLSTSRHITQGIIDLSDERWDPATRTLSGTSKVVGNDTYELRIVLPGNATIVTAEIAPEDKQAGVTIEIRDAGPRARIILHSSANHDVRWRLTSSTPGA